jgi:protein ImuB
MAFASIYVPNFMVQAVVRAEPELRGGAIALIDGTSPVWNVVAASEAAVQAGIELDMTKSQAAQFCAVEIRRRSRAQEAAAHAALLDLAWSVSPRVEDTAPDTIVLDLTGLTSLFGCEEKIARQLAERASRFGLVVHVAVAANLEAALHAARGFPGITLIPAGEESRHLGSLPLCVLSPPAEILETLECWGVRTCAALAALPVLALSERLGQPGVRLHEWACGTSLRSLVLAEPTLHFEEEMELDYAVAELEPLLFPLGRLLDQLCARLVARSLAAGAIRLRFDMEVADGNELPQADSNPRAGFRGGSRQSRQDFQQKTSSHEPAPKIFGPKIFEKVLTLPVPVRDSKLLLKLIRLQLQSDPPPSSIIKILLAADPAAPRVVQRGLFLPSSPDPEKLELMIARLAHLVGDANIGAPQLMDTHRPGEFRMSHFPPSRDISSGEAAPRKKNAVAMNGRTSRTGKPSAAFRIFRPAPPALVEMCDGRPVRVSFHGRRGDVVAASGPWRTSGDWWREDAWQQDEWDLEIRFAASPGLSSGSGAGFGHRERIWLRDPRGDPQKGPAMVVMVGLYRIYYDSLRRKWFVRGVYD